MNLASSAQHQHQHQNQQEEISQQQEHHEQPPLQQQQQQQQQQQHQQEQQSFPPPPQPHLYRNQQLPSQHNPPLPKLPPLNSLRSEQGQPLRKQASIGRPPIHPTSSTSVQAATKALANMSTTTMQQVPATAGATLYAGKTAPAGCSPYSIMAGPRSYPPMGSQPSYPGQSHQDQQHTQQQQGIAASLGLDLSTSVSSGMRNYGYNTSSAPTGGYATTRGSRSGTNSPTNGGGVKKQKRLHQCSWCPKAFTKQSNRRIHERLHTQEYPYYCRAPSCGKRFMWRSSINFHEKNCLKKAGLNPATTPFRAEDERSKTSRRSVLLPPHLTAFSQALSMHPMPMQQHSQSMQIGQPTYANPGGTVIMPPPASMQMTAPMSQAPATSMAPIGAPQESLSGDNESLMNGEFPFPQ